MRMSLLLLITGVVLGYAQQPPYDHPPSVETPYYSVRFEGSSRAGELMFPVQYTLWVPRGVDELRGVVVHQHGCGEGSCLSGQTGAYDLHWQALARRHGCALLSPTYEQPDGADCQMWCDPRNGSGIAFQRDLKELGVASGHPELTTIPWALWGHSGGGHWVGGMTMLHPERVVGAWLRSGVPLLALNPQRPLIKAYSLSEAVLKVPMMCNFGTKEGVTVRDGRFSGVWPANETFFHAIRSQGGLVGVAVDPFSSHDCGNQRYLSIPWLDHFMTTRLPDLTGEPLRPVQTDSTWLASPLSGKATMAGAYEGNSLTAAWIPNERLARLREHYVRDTKVPDVTPPPAPTQIRLKGNELRWEAAADLESGLTAFVILLKGREIARVPDGSRNRFGRPLFQGLQYSDTPVTPLVSMRIVNEALQTAEVSDVRVIAVNTVGLHSE